MSFDLERFRVERFQAELGYHATWTFYGLRGILGESWAHGPTFGAFADVGPGQVNLTPAPTEEDPRITAVAGIRASGLLAEGQKWTRQAPKIAHEWLADVLDVLKPQTAVSTTVELFGLYPIRNPDVATSRLLATYHTESEYRRVMGSSERQALTAIDVFFPPSGDEPGVSYVVGLVGPPHRGMFFNHEDKERDTSWWVGVRLNFFVRKEEGISAPLETLDAMISGAEREFRRVATATLPGLVH